MTLTSALAPPTAVTLLDVQLHAGGEIEHRVPPFCMNTREELVHAMQDFDAGRMGRLAPSFSF